MDDTLIGHFPDRRAAAAAVKALIEQGVAQDRLATRTTIEAAWRGLAGSEDDPSVFGDKHSPAIRRRTQRPGAADVLVTVRVGDRQDPAHLTGLLESLGATATELIEGTPPGLVER